MEENNGEEVEEHGEDSLAHGMFALERQEDLAAIIIGTVTVIIALLFY